MGQKNEMFFLLNNTYIRKAPAWHHERIIRSRYNQFVFSLFDIYLNHSRYDSFWNKMKNKSINSNFKFYHIFDIINFLLYFIQPTIILDLHSFLIPLYDNILCLLFILYSAYIPALNVFKRRSSFPYIRQGYVPL